MAVYNNDYDQPFSQWEEVDVTFPAVANTDLVIPHTLTPPTPDHVNYVPIRKDRALDVYHDTSATRRPWQSTYIVLRSTVASARVRLLLFVEHKQRTLAF